MADQPVDLIRLDGHGNSVVLRITGQHENQGLNGELQVETRFVRGHLKAAVLPQDLWDWRDALDGLDAGHDVAWREKSQGASIFVERDDDQAHVTIKDDEGTATTVTVTVALSDQWFDDAYERLDHVMKLWDVPER